MKIDRFYAYSFLLWPSGLKKLFERVASLWPIFFCSALDPSLGGSGRKAQTYMLGREYFIATKFNKHQLSVPVVNADCMFSCISASPSSTLIIICIKKYKNYSSILIFYISIPPLINMEIIQNKCTKKALLHTIYRICIKISQNDKKKFAQTL